MENFITQELVEKLQIATVIIQSIDKSTQIILFIKKKKKNKRVEKKFKSLNQRANHSKS